MTPNPYAPPQSPPEPPRASHRLFTAAAVAVHFLILPLLGAGLAVENYRRLHDRRGMWKAVAIYVTACIAMIVFGAASRSRWQTLPLWGARIALAVVIFRDQRRLVHAHFAAGGRSGRWALVWLALLPPLFILFLAVWQILQPGAPRHP